MSCLIKVEKLILIKLLNGKNEILLQLYCNDNLLTQDRIYVTYIEPYKHQFLENFSNVGFSTHFGYMYQQDDENDLILLKNMGVFNVRDDIRLNLLNNSKYDFKWISKLNENNIDLYAIILGAPGNNEFGSDNILNNSQELKKYEKIIYDIKEKYNKYIYKYEIDNEPNWTRFDKENIKWYGIMSKSAQKILRPLTANDIVIGATCASGATDKKISSLSFFNELNNTKTFNNGFAISVHSYDLNRSYEKKHNEILETHKVLINDLGGFTDFYVSEYGTDTSTKGISEKDQAILLLRQSILNNKFNVNKGYIYCFRDRGTDIDYTENNYGVVKNNYDLKEGYFVIKNYLCNINGSEYIGEVNIASDIEAYLFDKDGKPKIIAWATTDKNTINIDYSSFIAKDMYGNDIKNTNGKLEISNSPVYLDNVSNNYFYQAISNSITSGYSQFKSKFADEIANVDGLTAKINDLNNQAIGLKNVSTFDENKANELMKAHFELGNMIMYSYEDGRLDIEYVKLSSMLDYLNNIGNSYEDLVTVSAKTRITDLSDITKEVNTAKSLAQDNEKFDIVYPNKIYKFAQDLLDTSSYVLELQEENDIKTGLINSKTLHAKYLAEWSQEFSKIYMKDALKDSLNKIIVTNQGIKQNYPNVLLDNEINQKYKDLNNSLKEISDNIEKCNSEKINTIYNEQVELVKLIVEKYYSNEIKIYNNSFATLIKNMIGTLSEYENLYKYYAFEGNISDDDLVNTLNSVINRYNDNRDIDLSMENEIINKLSETYQNINSIEDETIKYFNKLNIKKTCEIVSNILEGDIKNNAESEYKVISINADVDLSKPINKDITITINLPNEKSKITNNIGSNILKFTENGEYIFNINIRGYDYTYKVTINNIDKTLPKLNIKNTGTSITATAADNNIKELNIEKDGKK